MRVHASTQHKKMRRRMRMIVSTSSDMRILKSCLQWCVSTAEEFCNAAERHGLKVNFCVAKTEALVVLRGVGRNKVKK